MSVHIMQLVPERYHVLMVCSCNWTKDLGECPMISETLQAAAEHVSEETL